MQAIILAGGKGVRLKPFTTCIPKPLLPIDDTPILEIILKQLKNFGFTNFVLSLNYLADLLIAFFNTGEKYGIDIEYSIEESALGTAGPISIIDNLEDTFLVMNGDLLTSIDYNDLYNFHLKNENDVTISVFNKEVKIDLGVIQSENEKFLNYIEKPIYNFDVSMGIYVFNKNVVEFIPKNLKMDIPDLITLLSQNGKKIGCYRGDYDWLDIGRFDDYDKATSIFREKRGVFLPNEKNIMSRIK
ncbi:MAG: sugar phosphate nucleotidyltransferase [Bacillota bacterium]|nr:sugar phosphate nucleotidyltransferase [Bacillota bacterium]